MPPIVVSNAYSGINISGGGAHHRVPFGHLTVAGKIGETIRIEAASLYTRSGMMFQGVYAQAIGGSVNIQATLAPVNLALDSGQDGGGHWSAAQTLATPAITKVTNPATVLLITFTTAATLYLLAV